MNICDVYKNYYKYIYNFALKLTCHPEGKKSTKWMVFSDGKEANIKSAYCIFLSGYPMPIVGIQVADALPYLTEIMNKGYEGNGVQWES